MHIALISMDEKDSVSVSRLTLAEIPVVTGESGEPAATALSKENGPCSLSVAELVLTLAVALTLMAIGILLVILAEAVNTGRVNL